MSESMGNVFDKLWFGTIGENGEVSKLQGIGPIHNLNVEYEEPEEEDSVKAFGHACENLAKNFGTGVEDMAIALKNLADVELTFNFEIPIKGISRKRLKKLLMSQGYGRNAAEEIVWDIWKKRGSYTMLDTFGWF